MQRAQSDTRQWLILIGLTLGVTVTNGFARFAYGLILPSMKQDLGWSYAQAGWINTANALGYVFGAFATLALIHRVSSARLFSVGMLGTAGFLLATAFTKDFLHLTNWRVLTGVFGALAFIAGGALSATLFQDRPKRNALSIAVYFGVGGGLGLVLSGAVLPTLFELHGPSAWPIAWGVLGAASLLVCPYCIWASESLRPPVRARQHAASLPIREMTPEILSYLCFGLGYIVYITFLVALMQEQAAGPGLVSIVWVVLGLGIMASPFAWTPLFSRHSSGLPLALIMLTMSVGTCMAVLMPNTTGLILSSALFGLSVFMAPGAVTNFSRRNLPQTSWGAAVSLFTILFAVGQTIGPVAAGVLADAFDNIGLSLLVAGATLLCGAAVASFQKPLESASSPASL